MRTYEESQDELNYDKHIDGSCEGIGICTWCDEDAANKYANQKCEVCGSVSHQSWCVFYV